MCVMGLQTGEGQVGVVGLLCVSSLWNWRGSQRGEGGEPGVSLSCRLVWLLLVTLLDEIRGDQLSGFHVSFSLSLSLCSVALSRKDWSGTETGVGLKVCSERLAVRCKRHDCAALETLNEVGAEVSLGGGEGEVIALGQISSREGAEREGGGGQLSEQRLSLFSCGQSCELLISSSLSSLHAYMKDICCFLDKGVLFFHFLNYWWDIHGSGWAEVRYEMSLIEVWSILLSGKVREIYVE